MCHDTRALRVFSNSRVQVFRATDKRSIERFNVVHRCMNDVELKKTFPLSADVLSAVNRW
jgi:hypothetical protein